MILINEVVETIICQFVLDYHFSIEKFGLNIVSPGGLPNGVTIDEVKLGRSEIRNKVIARVFKELGYIEQWGGS